MAPIPSAIQNALGDAGSVVGIQQAYADDASASALKLGNKTIDPTSEFQAYYNKTAPDASYSERLWVRGPIYKCTINTRGPNKEDGSGQYATWNVKDINPDLYDKLVTKGHFSAGDGNYDTNFGGWAYIYINPQTHSSNESWVKINFHNGRVNNAPTSSSDANPDNVFYPVFTIKVSSGDVDAAGHIYQLFNELQTNPNLTEADIASFKKTYENFVGSSIAHEMLFANTNLTDQLTALEKETAEKEAAQQEALDKTAAAAVDAAAKTLSEMDYPTQTDVNEVTKLYKALTETQITYLTRDVPADIEAAQVKVNAASSGSGSDSSTGGNPDSGGSSSGSSTGGASTIIVNPTSPSVTVNPSTPDVTVNQGDTNLSVNIQGVDDLAIALRMQTVLGQLAMNPTQSAIDGAEADWGRLTDTQKRLVSNYESTMSFARTAIAPKTVTPAKQTKKTKVKTVTVNAKTVNVKAVKAAVKKANTAKKTASVKTVTKVVIGKKAKKVSKSAFKPFKKVTNLTIKSKSLTNESVKGSLADSKVKTVKVNVSNNKVANKKYVAKYKEAFAKANSGKKVTVKAGK